ncbi:hypothetical protein FIBSPDRAFT_413231 [Athelia psychrophila]|uniref:Uncharacterized protein n=1 Tax=Athelia psychrophila TaxID=1759441 RepID=A0A167UWC9_9AGAM|nr:hypothetical protein FIBSPDRAFT_413231 [Fibularhizoctonia sp. CBS 109695]
MGPSYKNGCLAIGPGLMGSCKAFAFAGGEVITGRVGCSNEVGGNHPVRITKGRRACHNDTLPGGNQSGERPLSSGARVRWLPRARQRQCGAGRALLLSRWPRRARDNQYPSRR